MAKTDPKMTKGLQSKKNEPKKKPIPAKVSEDVELENQEDVIITVKDSDGNEVDFPHALDLIPPILQLPEQKITEKISVKYVFSEAEINEKGIQLGRLHQNVEQIRDEMKEIISHKKSQIDQSNTAIGELSRHVTNGYTFTDEVCNVKLMDPEPGKKSYYKMDGTFVETRSMMPMDYQAKMQFDLKGSQSDADDKAISDMDHGKDRIRD